MIPAIYFLVLIIELFGEAQMQIHESSTLLFATKPPLMLILILWVLVKNQLEAKLQRLLIAALFLSSIGDVFMMLLHVHENSFLMGLSSFLVAQSLFIVIFLKQSRGFQSLSIVNYLPVVGYGIGFMLMLFYWQTPLFLKLEFAVLAYAFIKLFMLLCSLMRRNKVSAESFNLVVIGAFLFVVSDTLIAFKMFSPVFVNQELVSRLMIMIFYGVAQFLIVKGILLSGVKQSPQPSPAS